MAEHTLTNTQGGMSPGPGVGRRGEGAVGRGARRMAWQSAGPKATARRVVLARESGDDDAATGSRATSGLPLRSRV